MEDRGQNQQTQVAPPVKNKCNDEETKKRRPTNITINTERGKICDTLFKSKGIVAQFNARYDKTLEILEDRQHLFKKTESNYLRYRNFDILIITRLLQFSDSIKTNIGAYGTVYKNLHDALKNIAKSSKDLQAKASALGEAGWKLSHCIDEDCNKTQRRALTGKAPGCSDVKAQCPDAETILTELVNKSAGLAKDGEYLCKSAFQVVGIQSFSSVDSLTSMQKKLDEQSKKFSQQINETIKAREGELKKLQEDMVKAIQENSKNWVDLNYERSKFEGYLDAATFLCKPAPCDCTDPKYNEPFRDGNSWVTLKKCAEEICDICKVVDNSFCCLPKPPENPDNNGEC